VVLASHGIYAANMVDIDAVSVSGLEGHSQRGQAAPRSDRPSGPPCGARRACFNRAAPSGWQWAPRRPGGGLASIKKKRVLAVGAIIARLGMPSRPFWHRISNDLVLGALVGGAANGTQPPTARQGTAQRRESTSKIIDSQIQFSARQLHN
jgi:hypothetical protein